MIRVLPVPFAGKTEGMTAVFPWMVRESLIDSVIHADGICIFLRPAASQKPRNSAAIPLVSFLAGGKNLLVIAKPS